MNKYCFGIDVGGTTVKLGLFNEAGDVLDKWEIKTIVDDNGKHILPDIAKSVEAKLAEKKIEKDQVVGIGMGVPGPIKADGVILKAVNLGWGTFNVAEELGRLTGLSVKVGNDANVAALGEMWKGGGQGHANIVMVTLGTGVGGGIIVDGRILTGANGAGGEIGHMHITDEETEKCGCGGIGCLEQVSSATGIVRVAKKYLAGTDKASVLRDQAVSAKTIFDAVKAGDEAAAEIADIFGKYLGTALANVACVADPEVFVIGGGVSNAGPILFDFIKKHYQKVVFAGCKDAEFALAMLGNDAGIYGAAKLILDK